MIQCAVITAFCISSHEVTGTPANSYKALVPWEVADCVSEMGEILLGDASSICSEKNLLLFIESKQESIASRLEHLEKQLNIMFNESQERWHDEIAKNLKEWNVKFDALQNQRHP